MRWWVALALVLAVAPAQAAGLEARLTVQGAAVFLGEGHGVVDWQGSLHDARLGHRAAPAFAVAGEASLLRYSYADADRPASSPAGYGHDSVLLDRQETPLGRLAGRLACASAGPDLSIRLIPREPTPVAFRDDFAIEPWRDLRGELFRDGRDAQGFAESAAFYPPPGGVLRGPEVAVPGPTPVRLVVTDCLVDVGGERIDTRWTSAGPALGGIGGARRSETRVLALDGHAVPTGPAAPGGPAADWLHLVAGVEADLAGDLLLQNARGHGAVNGTAIPPGLQMLQAFGPMAVEARYLSPSAEWSVAGTPSFVALNGQTVTGARGSWMGAAAAGAASLALGALAWALAALNRAADPSHRHRLELLRLISQEPGATTPVLARRLGLARMVARHHLSILARQAMVSRRDIGGAHSYTLNHATFDFRLPGTALLAGQALGFFTHPVRKAMLQVLEARGESSYLQMAGAWREMGLATASPSLVSYHAMKLHRLGLLARRRQGRAILWSLAFDRQGVLRHQRAAYLLRGRLVSTVGALERGPATVAELRRRLRDLDGDPSRTEGRLRRDLAILEATGFVVHDAAGYRLPGP